jgi:hypothetical protein
VVGQRDAQRRDAEAREEAAERDVALRVGVPLRQHDDGAARAHASATRAAPGLLGEEARAGRVVLGRGRVDGARPGEAVAREGEVLNLGERVEEVAAGERLAGVARENLARVVAVEMPGDELRAPLEGAHDAVRVPRRVPPLPRPDVTPQHPSDDLRPKLQNLNPKDRRARRQAGRGKRRES